jgi:putative transcriptional regulator
MTKSRILEVVHETATGMFEAGVMDQITMREFDIMCLPKIEKLEPQKIKAIRETAQVSQAVFAAVLSPLRLNE